MSEVIAPEADRIEGAQHPRDTRILIGQEAAEAAFLEAVAAQRLHHGWLITGPRGVGKATLAWRIARFLLSPADTGLFGGPASLDTPEDDTLARRIRALSEPRLLLLRRPYDEKAGRFRAEIPVDEVRRLRGFFGLSATDGGRRVVIVDSVDDLNTSAANALLKVLEEPPEGAVLLLVSHRPSGLLPTIRSRCRELRCRSLSPEDLTRALEGAGAPPTMALAALAGGSVGEAVRLGAGGGVELYGRIMDLMARAPGIDRQAALALADTGAGRGNEATLDTLVALFDLFLARLARTGVVGPPAPEAASGEAALMARLSPGPAAARRWAELQQTLGARVRQGRAVNLDPATLLLDMVLTLDETAASVAAR